ncbi:MULTISPECIES: hypothetical protein [Streptomyces]|uniref:Uncharacterized protein n=1 Tax=Streptomyces griseofuscus TaxID=146922 RepID=A0A426S8R3_9ACTN|nr:MULTISPECIES: hypothetical protein [Streptomyces]MBA9043661.1 hypothetical protein [Streptomyces murinus]MBJ6998881.1 hypothetical protein [Streptomyces sp. CRPSP2-6A1]RRQ73475.1 hypothetical protein CQW39_29445 [Streptomyces griseofuscus]RRQ86589.1 hypothetical protein CQW44_12105 [Streptomyces griseofuscus]
MKSLLARAMTRLQDTVSGRRDIKEYEAREAEYRSAHNRDANLAQHYIPTAPQIPTSGPGNM